jgi:tyrosinase
MYAAAASLSWTIRSRAVAPERKSTLIDYTQFTSQLEGYHNVVHGWVGGIMNNIIYSPSDPVFWMHHAMIDRLWSLW